MPDVLRATAVIAVKHLAVLVSIAMLATHNPWEPPGRFSAAMVADSTVPPTTTICGTTTTEHSELVKDGTSAGATSWASPNGYKKIQWYFADRKYVENGWNSRDYAVLVLCDNQNSCDLSWIGYQTDSTLARNTLTMSGYPGNSNNCSASLSPGGQCGGSQYTQSARPLRLCFTNTTTRAARVVLRLATRLTSN